MSGHICRLVKVLLNRCMTELEFPVTMKTSHTRHSEITVSPPRVNSINSRALLRILHNGELVSVPGNDQLTPHFLYSPFPDLDREAGSVILRQTGKSLVYAAVISVILLVCGGDA